MVENENAFEQPLEVQPNKEKIPPFSKKNFVIIGMIVFGIILLFPILIFVLSSLNPSKNTSQPLPTTKQEDEWIISLTRGQTASIPKSSIEITFVDADVPGENCFDCISSTTLEAKDNGQIKKLGYSCGGIAGECIIEQKAYGYNFEILEQPNKDLIKIKVKKE